VKLIRVIIIIAAAAAVALSTAGMLLSQTDDAQTEPVQTESAAAQTDSTSVPPEPVSTDQPEDVAEVAESDDPKEKSEDTETADSSESSEIPEEIAKADDEDDDGEIDAGEPSPKGMIRFGSPGRLDGIAAVVGSEIILHSELEAYAYMRLAAMGVDPDKINTQELLRESLDELIDNKVLLVRAMTDSTIHVRNDEVESTLNNHIAMILRQSGMTMEQFEAQLRIQQGTTLARFRTEARRAIREQLYKQKLQQGFFFSTKINRRDVERFYEQYSDSLPQIGESFELLKLSLRLATPDSVRQAAFDKIRSIKQQLDAGGDFAELAKKYSESPEGPSGGDLGYLTKGSTTELVFEERAFTLPVGQISEPFETRLGFHILLVEEKRDLRVKLRQILVRHAPTEQQREATIARLDSLRQTIKTGAEFEAAARSISADAATRTRGGNLGWLTLLEMTPTMRGSIQNLEEGQISAPVAEDNMLTIYMVNKRVDSRKLTLENDYAIISEKAKDIFAQKQLLDSVRKWREKVFIDVRI
jgi:peptidyl-prolyl cis-trans isomerase SurA